MSRSDLRTWTTYSNCIYKTLAIILPLLERRMAEEIESQHRRIVRARTARSAQQVKQSAIPAAIPTPEPPPEPLAHVARAARYEGVGRNDQATRRAAKGRHEAIQKVGGGGLTDVGESVLTGQAPAPGSEALPLDAFGAWTWQPSPTPPPLDESDS